MGLRNGRFGADNYKEMTRREAGSAPSGALQGNFGISGPAARGPKGQFPNGVKQTYGISQACLVTVVQ